MAKGYSSQTKLDRLTAEFATHEPVRAEQNGLSVVAHQFVRAVGTDAAEAGSTVEQVVATAHAALKGDIIRFTSGNLSGVEVKVWSVTANAIELAEDLSEAPAATDTFQILRHKYPVVDASGNLGVTLTSGPIKFDLDGVETEVLKDTVTPANSRPLPVELMGASGEINITAGNLDVQLTDVGTDFDAVRIGDGTERLSITAANQAEVAVTAALPAGTNNIGDVDVLSLPSLPAGTNNIGDVDVLSLPPVTATDLDIRDLSSAQDSVAAVQSGTWNITNISGTVSLPTGAATETTLAAVLADTATIDANVASIAGTVAGSELQVDIVGSLPSGTNNIGDVDVLSLPSIPAGTNNIGDVDVLTLPSVNLNYLDVVDFLDTPLLVASSTNIPASASTPLTVVASLAADVKKVQFLDTTGSFIGLYSDPAGTPVLQAIIGPGSDQTIELALPAATVLGVRNMENSAISAGHLAINFIG